MMLLLYHSQLFTTMIRKLGCLIISGFLIAVTTGITITMHYCGDRLSSFGLYSHASSCCHHDQCGHCKDEVIIIKSHDEFIPVVQQKLETELIPLQLYGINNIEVFELHVDSQIALFRCYSDISPPQTKLKISFLQTYLL